MDLGGVLGSGEVPGSRSEKEEVVGSRLCRPHPQTPITPKPLSPLVALMDSSGPVSPATSDIAQERERWRANGVRRVYSHINVFRKARNVINPTHRKREFRKSCACFLIMVYSYVGPREPRRVSGDSERKAKLRNSKWYIEGMGFICCDSRNKDISGRILLQERRTTVDHIGCRLLPIYHPRAQVIYTCVML